MKNILVTVTGIAILIGTLTPLKSNEPYIEIEDIYDTDGVLEEWQYPGKYSPVNIFDNDVNTVHAENSEGDYMLLRMRFKQTIECDEIQVLGGVAVDTDLYQKNNRPKEVHMRLFDTNESLINDKEIHVKEYFLKDTLGYQNMRFDKAYTVKNVTFHVLDVYPGTKYNDTCITELKFFNKGKEIPVNDVEKLKKDYVKWVGERLKKFFAMGKFEVDDWLGEAYVQKNGGIRYKIYRIGEMNKVLPYALPTKYEVKDSRLYMTIEGKRGLVNYFLCNFIDCNHMLIVSIGEYKYKEPVMWRIME